MNLHLFAKLFLFLVGGILIQLFIHVPLKSETHDNGVFNLVIVASVFVAEIWRPNLKSTLLVSIAFLALKHLFIHGLVTSICLGIYYGLCLEGQKTAFRMNGYNYPEFLLGGIASPKLVKFLNTNLGTNFDTGICLMFLAIFLVANVPKEVQNLKICPFEKYSFKNARSKARLHCWDKMADILMTFYLLSCRGNEGVISAKMIGSIVSVLGLLCRNYISFNLEKLYLGIQVVRFGLLVCNGESMFCPIMICYVLERLLGTLALESRKANSSTINKFDKMNGMPIVYITFCNLGNLITPALLFLQSILPLNTSYCWYLYVLMSVVSLGCKILEV